MTAPSFGQPPAETGDPVEEEIHAWYAEIRAKGREPFPDDYAELAAEVRAIIEEELEP